MSLYGFSPGIFHPLQYNPESAPGEEKCDKFFHLQLPFFFIFTRSGYIIAPWSKALFLFPGTPEERLKSLE